MESGIKSRGTILSNFSLGWLETGGEVEGGINSRGTTLAKVCKIEHVKLIGKGTNRIS